MLAEFEMVRAIGVDLDGTLYESTPDMNDRVRDRIAEMILDVKPELGDVASARQHFNERYRELESGSGVLREAGYSDPGEVMDNCLATADITDLIPSNPELGNILGQIRRRYEMLYLLTASPRDLALEKLEKIRVPYTHFDEAYFSDSPEAGSKSDGSAFQAVIQESRIPAEKHVYIGDRKNSDILPAKNLGIKTVSVWSEIPEADTYIERINDIGEVLL